MRTQVAYAIATIASIEVPRREWLELIPSLCDNAMGENVNFKNAALETLGFLCDEITPDDLNFELKNKVVFALSSNVTANPNLLKTTTLAIKALF